MKTTETESKNKRALKKLLERLHNPLQLRIVVTVVLLVSWYVGLAMPLTANIEDTTRLLGREKKRLDLAKEIEGLRAQLKKFDNRIPTKIDSNEWIQYMLAGVRDFPLKLNLIDADKQKEIGPYKAMVLRVDIEGKYSDVNAFLRWLEKNPRLLRIDSIRMEPQRGGQDILGVRLIVLGVTG